MVDTRGMAHRFTNLHHTIDKLLEAEYFLAGLVNSNGLEFQFNLNAFLSACRSTSFVLQKSMASLSVFDDWYHARRDEMKADPAMRFFVELRNISQKEGSVSYVGASLPEPPGWTYHFAGNREAVPSVLMGQDVATSCAAHLAKLSILLRNFTVSFPYDYCITAALTPSGMAALGFMLYDVTEVLGFPASYLDVADSIPIEEKLRILSREFDPVDMAAVERMAAGKFQDTSKELIFIASRRSDLAANIAEMIESGDPMAANPRVAFIAAIGRRIKTFEDD